MIERAYADNNKEAAFENACECLIYGCGKQYWIDMGWNLGEDPDEIWKKAFQRMAEESPL